MSRSDALAPQALAREVECLVATGSMERARELVRLYRAPCSPTLELQIDSCANVDAVEVGRAVAVELKVAIGASPDGTTTQVSVGCRGPFYQVRVDDPLTGKTLRRLVDLRREPIQAQARLLGIGIRESGAFWQVSGSADLYSASKSTALSDVSVTLASMLLAGGVHLRYGQVTGSVEVGGRFGVSTASGEAAPSTLVTGNATSAAWGGPVGRIQLDVTVLSWLALGVSGEAGYAFFGVDGRALGDTVVDTSGFWVNPTARLVFILP